MKFQVDTDGEMYNSYTIEDCSCEWDEWFVKFRNANGCVIAMFAIRTVLSVIEIK